MNVEQIKQKLEEVATRIVDRHGAFYVELQVRRDRGELLIQVFVDTDTGITIDRCAEIGRDLARQLEVERVLDSPYRLEVSSPGLEKPLRLLRQYRKNVGRRFRIRVVGESGPRPAPVTLIAVDEDRLTFMPDGGEAFTLTFNELMESKEELPW